jgi:L,D-transpeptidase ErfK/SrfK
MRARFIILFLAVAGLIVGDVSGHASEPAVITGVATTHVVVRGETLTGLAARFGVYAATVASENHLLAGRPLEVGRELRIDNRHIVPAGIGIGEILINVPQLMLFYRDGDRVFAYPIAVGRTTWQTPQGPFTVIQKEENPAWHVPASIRAESARTGQLLPLVVPPGPRNPLGPFWIGLSLAGIGVHGTPFPSSIYQTATHGCIRLQNDRIEDLYGRVTVGTRGRIIYEPVLMAASGDEVYLEVHPDAYGRLPRAPFVQARELATRLSLDHRINWMLADPEIERHAGVARRVTSITE